MSTLVTMASPGIEPPAELCRMSRPLFLMPGGIAPWLDHYECLFI